MARYILGIDYGTSLTKAVIFDHDAKVMASVSIENKLYYPNPGWVEQDPNEILITTQKASEEALKNSRIIPEDIEAIGISNQLASTIFWNKKTGEAVGRAIVWQDNRSLSICSRLRKDFGQEIESHTSAHIVPNGYATKILWLLENDRAIQRGVVKGEILFGTIDTWLVWKLSAGEAFVTDLSNASLGLLFNTHTLTYDDWIINRLNIPREILPELRNSSEVFAYTKPEMFFGSRIPIAGISGDQFAAIFGHANFKEGTLHCNLGTGSSLTLNTGSHLLPFSRGVEAPILWAIDGQITRGLGTWSNFSGAAIQWLRNEMGIIHDLSEAEAYPVRVSDTAGVYFMPCFTGLGGSPYDPYPRGAFLGITQSTTRCHLVRATVETMAYQVRNAYDLIAGITKTVPECVRVGGGGSKNEFLMQFLADILGIPVERPVISESSVLGAAFLAGLATGYWDSQDEIQKLVKIDRIWVPKVNREQSENLYQDWKKLFDWSTGFTNQPEE